MNTREIVRRLQAFRAGKALPRSATLHFHTAQDRDLLIVAFVRMGGESRPWGVAYGTPGRKPTIHTVPEARNRDLVAGMMAEFAPVLLRHFLAPGFVPKAPDSKESIPRLRQIWLPNPTHLDMLHHLAYAYTFTRGGGEHQNLLRASGRLCGWLFREAQRPGAQHVLTATDVLRNSFTFPAEDVRQGHLGYLLAWLETRGNRERRMAAAMAAERRAIATTLDPAQEREVEKDVEAWGKADRAGQAKEKGHAASRIHDSLRAELAHRWSLTEEALGRLRADRRRVNKGVPRLVAAALDEQWHQYLRIEYRLASPEDGPAFVPSPETDRHPAAAGSRYLVHEASADLVESLLLLDDPELQAEAVSAGDAFRGVIRRVTDEGNGRAVTPVWTVVDEGGNPLRLRAGTTVCLVAMPQRKGRIRKVENAGPTRIALEIEITGRKTAVDGAAPPHHLPPIDRRWVGETLTFTKESAEGIARRKSYRIWKRDVPGAWLTHDGPHWRRRSDEVDIDDVAAVENAMERNPVA